MFVYYSSLSLIHKLFLVWVTSPHVAKPVVEGLGKGNNMLRQMYPAECRERHTSYKAQMQVKLNWRVDGGPVQSEMKPLGSLPIMVGVIVDGYNQN